MPGTPRPGACVWLSRAGRPMRADSTQLGLASGREEAYQELHDSLPMPWTARGEPQKLQTCQYRDISTDILESEEDPWTNTPWDVQTDFHDKPAQEQQEANTETTPHKNTARAAKALLQVPTRRRLRKWSQTAAQVTRRWRFILR